MSRAASNPLKTARWHKARRECFATWGHVCYWCGHGGANDVDHVRSRAGGADPFDVDNLRPIHGVGERKCRVCGRQCNREKSDKDLEQVQHVHASRDWYAA